MDRLGLKTAIVTRCHTQARPLSNQSHGGVESELLRAHQDLATDVFNAFSEAWRLSIERLTAGRIEQPSGDDAFFRREMDITGDPLPYGIEPNRQMLEAVIRQSLEESIIIRPFPEI